MGNLVNKIFSSYQYSNISNDNDCMEFWFLRMGTVGLVSQAYGRSDFREIVKTLLRNFIIALAAAFIIFIFTPLIKISIAFFLHLMKQVN